MWIMVAGPYRKEHARLLTLNQAALQILAKGHTPIIGVNMALPMIEAAGEDRYEELMMPVSLALAKRCDAILRLSGVR